MTAAAHTLSCCSCGQRRHPSAFGLDRTRSSGRASRCRPCARRDVRDRLVGEPGTLRRRLRNAAAEEHRQEREAVDPSFALRRDARRIAREARRAGIIHRPVACELCGVEGAALEGHHPDHRDALRVLYVCTGCHRGLRHVRPCPAEVPA